VYPHQKTPGVCTFLILIKQLFAVYPTKKHPAVAFLGLCGVSLLELLGEEWDMTWPVSTIFPVPRKRDTTKKTRR
jgi:hypothetical protein